MKLSYSMIHTSMKICHWQNVIFTLVRNIKKELISLIIIVLRILSETFVNNFYKLFLWFQAWKDSMFFTWTKYGCESAKHVLKGDDDILINPFELQKFLNTENKTEPVVYGCMLANQPVQKQVIIYRKYNKHYFTWLTFSAQKVRFNLLCSKS